MKSEPFHKLKVVGGLHKDAELFVEPEVAYRIGSGDECDIVLLDTGVESEHFAFRICQGKIHLESTGGRVFVDGRPMLEKPSLLSSFQVVSIGQAHLAFGPADEAWPVVMAPKIESENPPSVCMDLVPVDTSRNLPSTIKPTGSFQKAWQALLEFLRRSDKKMLWAAGAFLLVLTVFIYDTWQSCAATGAGVDGGPGIAGRPSVGKKSLLLSAVGSVMSLGRQTLVDAGWTEPALSIQAKTGKAIDEPVNHIRQVLKTTWGPNLMESRTRDGAIQFKGYDEMNRQDLLLNLKPDEQGQMNAEGVTLTLKKKKAILGQLGDLISVKVNTAEDMENLCQRMLEKKGIRKAKARFDIQDNSVTLQGQSDDRHTVTAIRDLVAKAFPEISINSSVKMRYPETENLNISGVCTSGAAHVVLKDGNKVFIGGKLDNGCTLLGIAGGHLTLDCQGAKTRQKL
jgi:hypothetical protein